MNGKDDIQRIMGQIEGQLERTIANQESHEQRVHLRLMDLQTKLEYSDARLSFLEKKIWLWIGAMGLLALAAGLFVSYIPFVSKLLGN